MYGLARFEAKAAAAEYLREESSADDSVHEPPIFLCRGGGVERVGCRPECGDRGAMMAMIAGGGRRVAALRGVTREQMRKGA